MWLKLNITNRKSSNRKCVNANPYKYKQTSALPTVLLEFFFLIHFPSVSQKKNASNLSKYLKKI